MDQQILALYWMHQMSFDRISKATGRSVRYVKETVDKHNKSGKYNDKEFFITLPSKLID